MPHKTEIPVDVRCKAKVRIEFSVVSKMCRNT